MSTTFPWSFNGAPFSMLAASSPNRKRAAVISRTHIPDSNTEVIDYMGRTAQDVTFPVRLQNQTAYDTLEALVGTLGTLVWVHGTTQGSFLISLSESQRLPDGSILATTEWVLP